MLTLQVKDGTVCQNQGVHSTRRHEPYPKLLLARPHSSTFYFERTLGAGRPKLSLLLARLGRHSLTYTGQARLDALYASLAQVWLGPPPPIDAWLTEPPQDSKGNCPRSRISQNDAQVLLETLLSMLSIL